MSNGAENEGAAPFEIIRPRGRRLPVVLSSPHSGRAYPPDFVADSRLDPLTLRRSEDCFVDELFAGAVALGAPMVRAHFPRAYVDPNREPLELDPSMFVDPLPSGANVRSHRVRGGLGVIARVVADGAEIYRRKLRFAEAEARLGACYRPYHAALAGLLDETRSLFGFVILIDCHSMPSVGGPIDTDSGERRVDFVIGDRHGASCDPRFTSAARAVLEQRGYVVRRNVPYAGGFTTEFYGAPEAGVHALQIEINRALYMDEARFQRTEGLAKVAAEMVGLVRALAVARPGALAAE